MKNKVVIISLIAIIFLYSAKAEAIWNPFKNWKVSPANYEYYKEREQLRSQIDRIICAYESRNLSGFMRNVDEDYFADKDILEERVRSNISKYSFIRINYVINNYVESSDGKISVSINYSRMREDRRTGNLLTDHGTTSFIFKRQGNSVKLLRMTRPFLF